MNLQTISQVSKAFDISARMIRYYEQAGLLSSLRNKSNAYRYYDDDALKRVQQITILRKLQIPVKQICVIMNNPDAAAVIDIFKKNMSELDIEITALSTIKNILDGFVRELEKLADLRLNLDFLGSDSVLKSAGALSLMQKNVKENHTLYDLNKAAEVLNRLKNVRIIYLPPMTVASAFCTGDGAYEKAWRTADDFIKQYNMFDIKPDLRVFRHERSNATGKSFGHEVWVSIPDDFDVPAPLTKKRFLGGQYAAHVLGDDGFLTYLGLQDWINESDKYQYDYDGNLTRIDPPIEEVASFGGIRLDTEEILNYRNYNCAEPPGAGYGDQIDVLFPVRNYIVSDEAQAEIPGSKEKCGYKASIVNKNKFRIMGFTGIITSAPDGKECKKGDDNHCVGCGNCGSSAERFEYDVKNNGRLDILNKFRKPGAPLLTFGSHDMDSQMRGGWRSTFCLIESDVTDVKAFMEHQPYIRTIDTAKWLIFELTRMDKLDGHGICMKLGYTWNGTISGSFMAYPDGRIGTLVTEKEVKSTVYCWYPVK